VEFVGLNLPLLPLAPHCFILAPAFQNKSSQLVVHPGAQDRNLGVPRTHQKFSEGVWGRGRGKENAH